MVDHERRRESDKFDSTRTPAEVLAEDLHHWKNYMAGELRKGAEDMVTFRADLAANTDATVRQGQEMARQGLEITEIKKDTAVTREILQNWRAGRNLLSGIGSVGVWFLGVAGSLVLIIQAIKGKLF